MFAIDCICHIPLYGECVKQLSSLSNMKIFWLDLSFSAYPSLTVSYTECLFIASEQQPLRLNPAEVCEVIAAVCSETPAPNALFMTASSKLSNNSGKPSIDVAASVLVKLVIDM